MFQLLTRAASLQRRHYDCAQDKEGEEGCHQDAYLCERAWLYGYDSLPAWHPQHRIALSVQQKRALFISCVFLAPRAVTEEYDEEVWEEVEISEEEAKQMAAAKAAPAAPAAAKTLPAAVKAKSTKQGNLMSWFKK